MIEREGWWKTYEGQPRGLHERHEEMAFRPTIEHKWDPFQRDRLPDVSGLELQYRKERLSPLKKMSSTHRHMFLQSGVGFLWWTWVGIMAASFAFEGWYGFLLCAATSVFITLFGVTQERLVRGVSRSRLAVGSVLSLLMWGFGHEMHYFHPFRPASWLFTLVCVGIAVLFADAVASHYVAWLTANPRLRQETKERLRRLWKTRFQTNGQREPGLPQDLFPAGSYRRTITGLLLGTLSCPALILLVDWPLGTGGRVTLFLSVLGLGAIAALSLKYRKVVWEAVMSWYTYGHSLPSEPGVFESPHGMRRLRVVKALAVHAVLASLLIPAAGSYGFWGRFFGESSRYSDAAAVSILLSLVAAASLPTLVGGLIVMVVTGRTLQAFYDAVEAPEAPLDADRKHLTEWEWHAERLRESKDPRDRDHIFLGTHSTEDYPVMLPRAIFTGHSHFEGGTGSGKTATVIAPILTQVIRRADAAAVVIDLKGDMALFETCRIEAERAGLAFKFFTNETAS